jgi:hypothetical protein
MFCSRIVGTFGSGGGRFVGSDSLRSGYLCSNIFNILDYIFQCYYYADNKNNKFFHQIKKL